MTVGMDNVEQSHNVGITHLLEEGNLADGGGGNALILGLKTNLLERDNSAIVGKVSRLVDNTVGTCIKRECMSANTSTNNQTGQKQHTLANLLEFLVILHRAAFIDHLTVGYSCGGVLFVMLTVESDLRRRGSGVVADRLENPTQKDWRRRREKKERGGVKRRA